MIYKVNVLELHRSTYKVDVENIKDALDIVANGDAEFDNGPEFIEIVDPWKTVWYVDDPDGNKFSVTNDPESGEWIRSDDPYDILCECEHCYKKILTGNAWRMYLSNGGTIFRKLCGKCVADFKSHAIEVGFSFEFEKV